MKQVTLTKIGIRIIEMNVSQKSEGFKPRDNRKWNAIATKLLDAIHDYDDPVQDLSEEAERIQGETDLDTNERDDLLRSLNRQMREIDEAVGQDEVTLVLESEELNFIHGIWQELPFRGDRTTRARINAISDALEPRSDTNPHGYVEIKIVDGVVMPVDSPAPRSNGRPKQLALKRR